MNTTMSNQDTLPLSLFELLRSTLGTDLAPIRCAKATLVHLSHTLEDLVLERKIPALLFTGFQESSHWREETERYRALADIAQQVCIFAGGQPEPDSHEKEIRVTLVGDDPLRQEWFVVMLSERFSALLCGQDCQVPAEDEATRQFETLWSFEPDVISRVLDLLEDVVGQYRPERLAGLQEARQNFTLIAPDPHLITVFTSELIRFEEELHQQLYATMHALEKQIQWRDDLTATLVHDMRSPLQSLLMSIQMIRIDPSLDREAMLEMLAVAERGTNNLQRMVQLILDTNQIEAGQLTLTWQPNHPLPLIEDAVSSIRSLIMASNFELQIEIDPRVKIVWGDPELTGRILQNLVGNAAKFTPVNGQITIGVAPAPTGNMVELRVQDTGDGIPQNKLSTIFERYSQADRGDRRGNGMGLYFCRVAAEAHGGSIRADSRIGKGTAVTVSLPLRPPLN